MAEAPQHGDKAARQVGGGVRAHAMGTGHMAGEFVIARSDTGAGLR